MMTVSRSREGAAKSADRDLAAFARQALPTPEEHKQLAPGCRGIDVGFV